MGKPVKKLNLCCERNLREFAEGMAGYDDEGWLKIRLDEELRARGVEPEVKG